ncbi:VOC family protein [Blastococcus sp. URHD0036]|uniref:VOC family protein n=1 Tax=Blastococcus sp. URHD0036 TaxID=1380356 RepID=UPI000495F9A6|nr:VOC family protein [Blastococcus sp. URHD0036]
MPSTVQPTLITRDVDRLLRFYVGVAGAEPTDRQPPEGPVFYQGLRIGDSDLGIVAVDDAPADPGRVLLSIAVADVDAALPRVEELGGAVQGPPNDMPWGERVAHVRDPDGNALNLTTSL